MNETALHPTSTVTPARAESGLEVHIAGIRAQLAPIASRSALLDSYRRESLNLLVPATVPLAADAAALEIAYALRWLELPEEQLGWTEPS